mgnify:CR=1 FL=1
MAFESLLPNLEVWAGRLGALLGLATLAVAVVSMVLATERRPALEVGSGARYLRWPFLIAGTVLFLGAGVVLWRPLPIELTPLWRLAALLLGLFLFLLGLSLYLWGGVTLGKMFAPSFGSGVRLQAERRLVTGGPFRLVRHPMYLAVILTFSGGLLLYRTWTMLVFAICMFGLMVRARREEALLSAEFGEAWKAWAREVPAWVPRPGHIIRRGNTSHDR